MFTPRDTDRDFAVTLTFATKTKHPKTENKRVTAGDVLSRGCQRAWMMGGECDAIDEWLVDWGNATTNRIAITMNKTTKLSNSTSSSTLFRIICSPSNQAMSYFITPSRTRERLDPRLNTIRMFTPRDTDRDFAVTLTFATKTKHPKTENKRVTAGDVLSRGCQRAWMMGGECDAIDEWLVDWGNATTNRIAITMNKTTKLSNSTSSSTLFRIICSPSNQAMSYFITPSRTTERDPRLNTIRMFTPKGHRPRLRCYVNICHKNKSTTLIN